jgi:molybdenum cofactor cytidylyltransferase
VPAALPGQSKLNAMPMPAIVLAAGASRRLGQPKQLVCIAGETLLALTTRIVREAGAGPVLTVLGANRETIAASVDLSQVHCVVNRDWEQGISTSIRAGVSALQQIDPDAQAVLLLVCDQPRLTAEHVRGLIEAYEDAGAPSIAASEYAGSPGIPAIFPANQFAGLLKLEGDAGAKALLRNPTCPMVTRHFEYGEVDIDTPSDLAANLEP